MKSYKKCFVGKHLVDWLIRIGEATDRTHATEIGAELHLNSLLHHVTRDHTFKDESLYYRFLVDCDEKAVTGSDSSWSEYASGSAMNSLGTSLPESESRGKLQPAMKVQGNDIAPELKQFELSPLDKWNLQLLDNVHPPDWKEPTPQDTYNLVVIGAGSGGLVSAAGAAGMGAKVALIEEHMLGGEKAVTGSDSSWSEYASGSAMNSLGTSLPESESRGKLQPAMKVQGNDIAPELKQFELSPLDKWNLQLLDNVHPPDWKEPTPQDTYNLVVIGAGSGGLVSAAGAAGMGAKVALIEEHMLGGDCLNTGCVPSKALLSAANRIHQLRTSQEYGVKINGTIEVDFGAIMERMRRLRAVISPADAASRFYNALGVDVFLGRGIFVGKHSVSVNGKTLKFAKCVIATGGRPGVPRIPGVTNDTPYLTSENVWNLTTLPKTLAVVGTGAIGSELSQCFARFGSKVTILARSGILSKEDPEASALVEAQLAEDGCDIKKSTAITNVAYDNTKKEFTISYTEAGTAKTLVVEHLLFATGRSPNVSGLGLDVAGVKFDSSTGIKVSDTLQTTNGDVFAVGDCATSYKFTHIADAMARIVIRNALFFGSEKMSNLVIPWCTYTHPELAHVGPYEEDLKKNKIKFNEFKMEFEDNDRSILEGADVGFVKVLVAAGTDKILAATIVGENAGNLISEITLMITHKIGLSTLAAVIHPYPTQADAVRRIGDLYNRTRMTTFVRVLFRKLLAARR
eukprot:TRINITY_DN867_c0_g2_i2.p1 TRINITY_DN867_c0_g2~~TRINITY_DN867_c0_g2_i2.p1  ORF type:complete len:839 (-),score=196.78 TRINITY_DN867_c0_g2_i2:160-2388(-)